MREIIEKGILRHIHELEGLRHIQLIEINPGYVHFSVPITEKALNMYGHVHGGFLFTLCDIASGMATYAFEVENVTLQSNINYVKAVKEGTLFVTCHTDHKGRATAVNHITIHNEQQELIATSLFTMFLTTPLPNPQ